MRVSPVATGERPALLALGINTHTYTRTQVEDCRSDRARTLAGSPASNINRYSLHTRTLDRNRVACERTRNVNTCPLCICAGRNTSLS